MSNYEYHLNQRRIYKEQRLKTSNALDELLTTRYDFSFKTLLHDIEISKNANIVKIIISKLGIAQVTPGTHWLLFKENGINDEVVNMIKPLSTFDEIDAKMDTVINALYEKGVKYLVTDRDVSNLYHQYERSSINEQMMKQNANSTYGNSTYGKFGANK